MMKGMVMLAALAPTALAQKAAAGPPQGCVSWNDGCNTCSISADGALGACTMMMCIRQGTPYCSRYADGRSCTSPTACAGAGQAEGARCSTTATRGNPNGLPCARGLVCQITDPGMIAADRPNSGICTSADRPIAIDPIPPPHPVDPLPPTLYPTDPIAGATQMCDASPRQMCRMLCPPTNCPAGQCAMRQGSCCDFTCQSSGDATVTVGGTTTTGVVSSGSCATQLATIRPMPGAFLPQCDENGDFQPVQCHASVGSCWCVSTDGVMIPGTNVNIRNGQMSPDQMMRTCAAASHPDIYPVDPGFGMPIRQTVSQMGERCAQGFCEDPTNCPQCAAGLTCNVPAGMMCAGTCYGTCGKAH